MASKGATLDMSRFFGTRKEKIGFCQDLLADDIHTLFEITRAFFNLPHEEKVKVEHAPEANPNRGCSYVGQENVANISGHEKGVGPGTTRDIKETLDMGCPDDSLVDNLWLLEEGLPGFRSFMESFYSKAFQTELNILSALAITLGISEEHLRLLYCRAENEFRLLHYPAIPASELSDGFATRIAEHTDFDTSTMLFQDSVGGLQVEDQTQPGVFHDVESSACTDIILNIGDSLQRLTNDTFKAACHRVTYPPTVKANGDEIIPERYSIAYFAKPNRNAPLLPLTEFITDETLCKYDSITAWE